MRRKRILKITSIILIVSLMLSIIVVPAYAKTEQDNIKEVEKTAYIIAEEESMRSENEKVFRMSDGSMKAAIYSSPIHYRDAKGDWKEIDNSLKSNNSDEYVTKNSKDKIILSKKYKKGKAVEIASDEYNISWGFIGAKNSSAETKEKETKKLEGEEKYLTLANTDSKTVYKDIYENIDAEYIIAGDQVKENLILKDESAQNEFEIEYRFKKLTAVQKDNKTIELKNSKNKTVYTIKAPLMTDKNGEVSDALSLKIISSKNNKLAVKLSADKEWLENNQRSYPVTVDPNVLYNEITFSTGSMDSELGYINKSMICGKNGGAQKIALVEIDGISTLPQENFITKANLNLYGEDLNGSYNLYQTDLTLSDLQEYNLTRLISVLGYDPKDNYTTGAKASESISFDITTFIQQNLSSTNTFAIKNTKSTGVFAEFEVYGKPILTADFIRINGVDEHYAYHSNDMGEAGTAYVNDITGELSVIRNDLTADSEGLSINAGMIYKNKSWIKLYNQKIDLIRYGYLNAIVWQRDDGTDLYFSEQVTEEGKTFYKDDNGYGYKLFADDDSYTIEGPDNEVYIFGHYTYNQYCLTKITNKDYLEAENNTYSKYINIDYTNSTSSELKSIEDNEGNYFLYSGDNIYYYKSKTACENDAENNYQNADDYVKYTFSTGGKLISAEHKNQTSRYTYDNKTGSISSVADSYGYKLNYYYDDNLYEKTGNCKVVKIEEEAHDGTVGNALNISYQGNKTVFSDLNNYDETEIFDEKGHLITTVNKNDLAIIQKQDETGGFISQSDIMVPTANILVNHNMEKDVETDWTLYAAATGTYKFEPATDKYFSGKQSYKYVLSNQSTAHLNQDVKNPEPGTYTLSAYFLTENVEGAKGAGVLANVQDQDGDWTPYYGNMIKGTNDWTRSQVTFDVPEGAKMIRVFNGMHSAKGTAYVDANQLEKHKRAYNYNLIENADFTSREANSSFFRWKQSDNVSNITTNTPGGLDNNAVKMQGNVDEDSSLSQDVIVKPSKGQEFTLSFWNYLKNSLPNRIDDDRVASVEVYKMNSATIVESEPFAVQEISTYIKNAWNRTSLNFTTPENCYGLRIKVNYNKQYGYMLVDGFELYDGNLYNEEDSSQNEDETTESESEDDYQIEDGYQIVSKVNSFDNYAGRTDCSYIVNGTKENGTAYLGNSWGVTANKDKYDNNYGGVWIGSGKLNTSTQSGIRFWYKSNYSCTVSLRNSTYGKGGSYDYSITLPAAPNGAWKTLLYKDIETTTRKVSNFNYFFVKITNGPVYIDEIQTVLADATISLSKEYEIADESEVKFNALNYYPIIDKYVYSTAINRFNYYKGDFGYLVNGSKEAGTAFYKNSWGVTENKDIYTYVDENGEHHWSYGIQMGGIDTNKYSGIRFWYLSKKACKVSIRKEHYGDPDNDYTVDLPAAPNGDWYTILFEDIKKAGKKLNSYRNNLFVKTCDSPAVYIDELQYVKLSDYIYDTTETIETSRDGQQMKTVSATRDITVGNIACTLSKETNSVGVDTFTTNEKKSGNQISATDGNGNKVNYSYDDLNNLVKMSQTVGETDIDCEYTYSKGKIASISSHGVNYTYAYTPFGDLKSISVGNTKLIEYSYVSNQNRIVSKITYANGQTVNNTYDADSLLTKVINKNGSTATNTISYDYDETGVVIETTDAENKTVTKTILNETQVWNLAETKLLYSYSSDDNSLVENINGREYKTNYTGTSESDIESKNISQTAKTTSYGNTTVTTYSDNFGRIIKEVTKSNNTVVLLKEYTYNTNGKFTTDQVKSIKTTVGTATPETTRYTYDNNGNITGIYSKVGSGAETTVATYEYDSLNQLVKENNKTYSYDNGGNILTAGNNSYSYSTGEWKDKLTSFNDEDITYDESGNPLNYLGAELTWKNGRSLASYDKGNTHVTYKYNTDGLRTEKNANGTVYKYNWNGRNLTHQSWDNKYIHFYYDNSDNVLGFTYYDGTTSANYTYAKNMQGDVVGIVDANGNTVTTYTYDAWGNILTANGDLANINPIRYRSYYYDDEIDMYYLQSRYYDQNVGRFVNSDSVILVEELATQNIIGTNLFNYCANNAVNEIDFSGYWKISLNTIRNVVISFGLNPIAAVLIGLGIYKFKMLIALKYAKFLLKLGAFGGIAVKAAVAIVGAIIGWKVLIPIATKIFDAIVQRKKGIEITLKKTWFGMPYGINVGVY